MIDLHSHIVFGVDDGSQTFDNSLKMLAKAQKDRITDIVASSHYIPSMKEQYAKNFELLQIKAREFNISFNSYVVFFKINFVVKNKITFFSTT